MEKEKEKRVMALGFFDGVHKGHMKLIDAVLSIAEEKKLRPALMTFSAHPLSKIFPAYTPWLITNNHEKIELIENAGIQEVFLDEFTDDLMQMSPENFVKWILVEKYHVKHVVVGFNYSFGWHGEGKTNDLVDFGEQYGFEVTIIPPYVLDDTTVSSTKIRDLISEGKVAEVPAYLGRFYQISGKVVQGKQLGRTFDFPTANLKLYEKKILPQTGVYFTQVEIDGKTYDGLTNLGFNPTFEKHPYSIETYIYDFNQDIYGKIIKLTFIARERGEIKFKNVEALIERIHEDVVNADRKYRQPCLMTE